MTACSKCRSEDLVGFELEPQGTPLRFTHCRNCEHRWWTSVSEASVIRLPDVLERIGGRAA